MSKHTYGLLAMGKKETRKRYIEQITEEFLKDYATGSTMASLAKKYNIPRVEASGILFRNNIETRSVGKPTLSKMDLALLQKEIEQGKSMMQISREKGISYDMLAISFQRGGIDLPPGSPQRKLFKPEHIDNVVSRAKMSESISSIADSYGVSPSVIIRILKQNKINYVPHTSKAMYINEQTGTSIRMRSTWEVRFAYYLDRLNVRWEYEIQQFSIPGNKVYIPDFWIYNSNGSLLCIVDVKGRLFEGSKIKINLFKERYPDLPFMLLTQPVLKNLGILDMKTIRHCGDLINLGTDLQTSLKMRYLNGEGLKSLARELSMDYRTLKGILIRENVTFRPHVVPRLIENREELPLIIEELNKGTSLTKIGAQFKIDRTALSRYANKTGLRKSML